MDDRRLTADERADDPRDAVDANGESPGTGTDRPAENRDAGRLSDAAASTAAPARPAEPGTVDALGDYLFDGETLRHVESVTLLDDRQRPATLGLTDGRLVAVTDAGDFLGVGFDRISAVRSRPKTTVTVRGQDARLLIGLGYALAVVGFLGVLTTAASSLTPVLALSTLGGVFAVDRVRRADDLELDARVATSVRRLGGSDALVGRVGGYERRLREHATDEQLAFAATGALAAVPFLGVVVLEGALLAPFLTLLTVGSVGLVVYAFRHVDEFDGIELVHRRRRTVSANVEDGSVVAVRTDPASSLDGELAALAGRAGPRSRTGTDPDRTSP